MSDEEGLSKRPIGLFDSGIGGLTVLQALKSKLPCEDFIYFGDTARVPYGGKSRETILRYSIENSIFLLDKNIKLLVVACNTASAYSVEKLRQLFSVPVIDVIEAGVKSAVEASKNKHIAILGTTGTIASGAYQERIMQCCSEAVVTTIPCPLFVPLVEERFVSHPSARLIVQEYLKPLRHLQIDTLLLGCTHYPLLKHLIQDEVGEHVRIVDSASSCADMVSGMLDKSGLRRMENTMTFSRYFVSDDPHKFRAVANDILGVSIDEVESISSGL